MGKSQYRGYRDLKVYPVKFSERNIFIRVYQLSYKLALEIHEITKTFPKEEKYSLVNQIRRSSRSVPANLAEGLLLTIYCLLLRVKMGKRMRKKV